VSEQTKQCRGCGVTHPLTEDHWYKARGKFQAPCKTCRKTNQKLSRGPKPAANPAANLPVPAPTKAIKRSGKTDMEDAINVGAALVKRNAAQIAARLMRYADDPSSPHHEWTMKLFGERIFPARRYGDTGEKAGNVTPNIIVNVVAAQPGHPAPVRAAITVTPIPDESERSE
jgi:hypothetical protein